MKRFLFLISLFALIPFSYANSPPTFITIISPQDDSYISNTVTIEAQLTQISQVRSVKFYIDNTQVGEDTTQPYQYNWDTTTYPDGQHQIYASVFQGPEQVPARANPPLLNSPVVNVTVDNSPPTIPLVTDDGEYFTTNTIHASWFSQDPESGIIEYYFSIGTTKGGQDKYNWTPVGITTEVTVGIVLTQGETYYFNVKAKNGAGLFSEVGSSDGITFDSIPPSGTIRINEHSRWVNIRFATSPEVTIDISASDAVSGLDKISLSNDGINYSPPLDYAQSINWILSIGDGTKIVYAKFKDKAGNWSGPVSDTITLDTIPPQVMITSHPDGYETNFRLITISGIIDDNAARVEVNGILAGVSEGKFTAQNVPLSEGQNTLTAVATDLAGHVSTSSMAVTYNPPELFAWMTAPVTFYYSYYGGNLAVISAGGEVDLHWTPVPDATAYHIFTADGQFQTQSYYTTIFLKSAYAPIWAWHYGTFHGFWPFWQGILSEFKGVGFYVKAFRRDGSVIYSNIAYLSDSVFNLQDQLSQENTTTVAEPINVATGNMFTSQTDISIPSREIPLELSRTYNSQEDFEGQFGYGWRSNYDIILQADEYGNVLEIDEKGVRTYYTINPDDTYTTSAGKYSTLTRNPDGTYTILRKHGRKLYFDVQGRLIKIEERNGNYINITRSPDGVISEVSDSSDRKLLFTKDPEGKIVQITDPANRVFKYEYDSYGNLIKTQDPLNNENNYEYDANHNLLRQTDVNGHSIFYEYDSNDRAYHSWQDGNNNEVRLSFDPTNNTTLSTDSLGRATKYQYNDYGLVTIITDSENNAESFVWDRSLNKIISMDKNGRYFLNTYDGRGNLLTVKDPLENTTSFTYEPNFDFVSSTTDAQGNITEYSYDAKGNLIQVKDALNNLTNYSYDSLGQLVQAKDANNNIINFNYDTYGNLTKIIDALNNQTTFSYDIIGNRIQLIDAANNSTDFSYDLLNRLTSITYPDNSKVTYVYDPVGNLISFTDQNNNQASYTYDEVNRLIKTTDAQGNATQYTYDTEGNRLSITDANSNKTQYTYDSLNRLIKTTFPDNSYETYSYDRVGNLTQKMTRKGDRINFTYDALNRLIKKRYPDATEVIYTYDSLSRLKTVADMTGTITHSYDALGRLASVTYPNTMQVSYEYDAVGNRTKLIYPDATYLTYAYDALNRLTEIKDQNLTTLANFTYDSLSRRTNLTLANGVTTSYSYDSLSRLLSLTNQKPPTTISFFNYTYDAVGNRLTKQSQEGTHTYTYDNIYQLTQVQNPDLSLKTYNFDPVGNRTTVINGGTETYTTNVLNQYTNVIASASEAIYFTYDLNGNLIQKTDGVDTTTYAYDFENRLVNVIPAHAGIQSLHFTYDPFGRRTQKLNNSTNSITNFIYDQDNIILDLDQNNQIQAKYIYGPSIDEPLALIKGSSVYYYSKDGLGSVVNLTDNTGQVVESYTYDEYGNISAPSQVGNRYLYTSREYDPEVNLYYYRARYYDPRVGRFLQTDPIGYYGGINLYTYVKNNPVNWVDPFGFGKEKPWWQRLWDWYWKESVLPGPYGQPMSEWGPYGPTWWGDPMKYTEEAGGAWKWWERAAVGTAAGTAITAGGFTIAGFDPWMGTAGIHGAHHGMGPHFEFILKVGEKMFKLFIPGKDSWIYTSFK